MTDGEARDAVLARLDDIKGDVTAIRTQLDALPERYVPRAEWVQRNEHVDTQFRTHGREIGDLRSELRSRRAPWWSTWSVALAAAALAWSVLGPAIRG